MVNICLFFRMLPPFIFNFLDLFFSFGLHFCEIFCEIALLTPPAPPTEKKMRGRNFCTALMPHKIRTYISSVAFERKVRDVIAFCSSYISKIHYITKCTEIEERRPGVNLMCINVTHGCSAQSFQEA